MDKEDAGLGNASHAWFALVWRAMKAGRVNELSSEGQRLAAAMAEHPEWQDWWERADDLGDAEVVVNETSPFAAVGVIAATEGLISKDGNRQARLAYRQLVREGWSHKEARAEIARALLGCMSHAAHGGGPLSELDRVLKRIRHGESTEEIFG